MGRREKERWVYINLPNIKPRYYQISSWGNIKNNKNNLLSYYKDKDGYLKCTLYTINGQRKHFMVHRLVALHFIPNPKNKPEVNHLKPWDKTNLYYKNFEWVSLKENHKHAMKYNLQMPLSCEAHGMASLTNDKVHTICKYMENGLSNKDIIHKFNITDKHEKEKFRGVLKHI